MTTIQLLDKCETYYREQYTDEQRAVLVAKLAVFDDDARRRLYSEVIEVEKKLPKVAEFYKIARAWGPNYGDAAEHKWGPTDCELCGGEGRLVVIWRTYHDKELGRMMERLEHVMPYSSRAATTYQLRPMEHSGVQRCKCEAGGAPTVPAGWPRWSDAAPPIRPA